MNAVKFGNVEVGTETPMIVGTVHMRSELSLLPDIVKQNTVDILELRADQLCSTPSDPPYPPLGKEEEIQNLAHLRREPVVVELARQKQSKLCNYNRLAQKGNSYILNSLREMKQYNLPVIATVREGEGYNFEHSERLELFEKLIPEVDAVDIGLKAAIRDEVIKRAKERKKTVIISEHNLKETPPESELERMVSEARSCGADITKIAAQANSPADVARLMCFTLKQFKEGPLVCISLGDIGAVSRIIAPLFGSCLTYGYIKKAVAPGQMSLSSLHTEMSKYFKTMEGRLMK